MNYTKYHCEEEESELESDGNEDEKEESDTKTNTVIIWMTNLIMMVMTRTTRLVLLNMYFVLGNLSLLCNVNCVNYKFFFIILPLLVTLFY